MIEQKTATKKDNFEIIVIQNLINVRMSAVDKSRGEGHMRHEYNQYDKSCG